MPRQQLVLIGPSAGWMLPTEWLTQFEEVHAWDIDPLAAPLFRWRHGQALKRAGTRLNLHTGDGLAQLDELTRTLPSAFFWFDNVLGQLRFTDPSPDAVVQRLKNLQRQLQRVAWGNESPACSRSEIASGRPPRAACCSSFAEVAGGTPSSGNSSASTAHQQ